MLQTRQKVFRNVPTCPNMSQHVPKCPIQTHRSTIGPRFQAQCEHAQYIPVVSLKTLL